MPVVKAYGALKVAAKPAADTTLDVHPQPEDYGSQLGATAARIGLAGVSTIWEAERQRTNERLVQDAQNQLMATQNELLLNPETGALNVKGKDALGLLDSVTPQFEQRIGEIGADLKNDDQRLAFERFAGQRRMQFDSTLREHIYREQNIYDQQEYKGAIDLHTQNAVANAGNPPVVAQELGNIEDTTIKFARRNGMGPEAAASLLQDQRTQVHAGVIDTLLTQGLDQKAQAYYDETKDQIAGETRIKVEKALEEGSSRGASQRESDRILATTQSEGDALDQAKQIQDPKLRDLVQQRVVQEWGLKKQSDREQTEQDMITAGNLMDKNPKLGKDAIPASLWVKFTPGEKASLEAYAKRNAVAADPEGKTDWATYYGLMQQASTDPQKFAQTNLMLSIAKLGKVEFKQLVEMQASIRKGDTKHEDTLDSFRSANEVVSDALNAVGIPTSGKDAEKPEIAQFRRSVDERVQTLQRLTGKKATKEDIQTISDDLLKQTVTQPGSWLGFLPGVPFFDVSKRQFQVTAADIPQSERSQIEAALRAKGRPVTDESVLDLFLATKRRTGALK